jgi:hypothetical protein
LLDFINRTRTGLFIMVWLLIMWKIRTLLSKLGSKRQPLGLPG